MSTEPQDSWEKDPVWNLLDESETAKASPAFAQNVQRQIRQLDSAPATPWWKKLLAPAPLAAAAIVTIMVMLSNGTDPTGTPVTVADPASLDEKLQQELLLVAVEEPDLFSDAELLAMLY